MPDYDVFPDAEAACGYVMRTAGVASARVYSSVPKTPVYPIVTMSRVGGIPRERHRLDRARIQVTAWGTSKSEAFDVANAARIALHRMEGTALTVAGGAPVDAFVTGVEDDLGMFWSPDEETARDRYVFGVAVYLHA